MYCKTMFLVTDTTLASDELLRFRKDLLKIKGKNKQKNKTNGKSSTLYDYISENENQHFLNQIEIFNNLDGKKDEIF